MGQGVVETEKKTCVEINASFEHFFFFGALHVYGFYGSFSRNDSIIDDDTVAMALTPRSGGSSGLASTYRIPAF